MAVSRLCRFGRANRPVLSGHSFALRQSRLTVSIDTPSGSAISSLVMPAKKHISTTWHLRVTRRHRLQTKSLVSRSYPGVAANRDPLQVAAYSRGCRARATSRAAVSDVTSGPLSFRATRLPESKICRHAPNAYAHDRGSSRVSDGPRRAVSPLSSGPQRRHDAADTRRVPHRSASPHQPRIRVVRRRR